MSPKLNKLLSVLTLCVFAACTSDKTGSQGGSAKEPPLFYELHGQGNPETIVLIHGFNSSQNTWSKVLKVMSKDYQVLVYDQPGHGLSPADGEDYSPQQMAYRLKALLNFLTIEKLHVVGHSMGGRTAVKFASLYPEMVSKLVVEDMNFLPHAESKVKLPALRTRFSKVRDKIPTSFPSRDAAVAALSAFYDQTETLFILSSASEKDGKVFLGNRPEVTDLYLHEGLALDMSEELKSIRCPSAFFAADPNVEAVLFGDGIEHIKKNRPDAQVKVFKGSNHHVHSRPEFTESLLVFLKSSRKEW